MFEFRLKFNALMTYSKHFNFTPSFDSVFSYCMGSCKYLKDENGFWALKCVEGQCKNVSSKEPP